MTTQATKGQKALTNPTITIDEPASGASSSAETKVPRAFMACGTYDEGGYAATAVKCILVGDSLAQQEVAGVKDPLTKKWRANFTCPSDSHNCTLTAQLVEPMPPPTPPSVLAHDDHIHIYVTTTATTAPCSGS